MRTAGHSIGDHGLAGGVGDPRSCQALMLRTRSAHLQGAGMRAQAMAPGLWAGEVAGPDRTGGSTK